MSRKIVRLGVPGRELPGMPGPVRHKILPPTFGRTLERVPPLPIQTVTLVAAFAADGTLTAGALTYSRLAAFGGAGDLSAGTVPVFVRAAQFGGEGTADFNSTRPADFNGAGSLSAAATVAYVRAAAFGGGGSLSAAAAETEILAAAFSGGGTLLAGVIPVQYAQAAFAGGGALTAAVREIELALAGFGGGGALTATAKETQLRAAGLSGAGALTATAVGQTFTLTLTPNYSDNFNARADGDLSGTSNGWDYVSTLAEPQVFASGGGKAIRGEFAAPSSRPNTRSTTETVPSGSRVGTYALANILGIGERVGVLVAGGVTAFFTNSTTLVVGQLTGSTTSNTPSTLQSFTVPAVSLPVELLIVVTSTTNVDVYVNRGKIGSATYSLTGTDAGVLLSSTTDIIDDYQQGTFV